LNGWSRMAKIILCLVFTVTLATAWPVLAQEDKWASKPFLFCNLIVVKTDEDTKSLRQKLQASLIRQGYRIASPDVKTITGKAKINDTFETDVTAVVTNGHINYSGAHAYSPAGAAQASKSHSTVILETVTWQIEYKGKENSDKMAAFAKMAALAKSYGGRRTIFSNNFQCLHHHQLSGEITQIFVF
jgi:hypothetical protein